MLKMTFALLAVVVLGAAACSSDDSSNSDCAQAKKIWGEKTQHLGQKCYAGSYGSCAADYDNCIEGVCAYAGDTDVCTKSCRTNSDCGGNYCKQGLCTPGASCTTYCDGTCCCEYHQDPSDPTQCVQGDCYCG